ncbi:MAG: hypothetical protein M1831_001519 [Alyxoria varia]|nr:MAG: hypothetical protein M1831_001519 [Alyxoria varia]
MSAHHGASDSISSMHKPMAEQKMPSAAGHGMSPSDPDNPMNWPLLRKLYASAVSFAFTFTLLNGLTSYAAGVNQIIADFNVDMKHAILGFSLYIFGIFFAPLFSPHVAEKFGRNVLYFASTIGMCAFLLGAGFSTTFTSFAVCRFFAGLFGGPNVVNIEGTFADIWPARQTGTYYAALTLASYTGAAVGPIICGSVVNKTGDWRWTQYIPLMFALATFLLATGVPETYGRQIIRNRARATGKPHNIPAAQSGETIPQMAKHTLLNPVIMLFTEPVVIMCTLLLSLNFAILFSWFIVVPAALNMAYGFTIRQAGLAFISAIGGVLLAAMSTVAIDQVTHRMAHRRSMRTGIVHIEYRLIPAILGQVFLVASLFWVGWTAAPEFHFTVPIVGTAFYVWGSAMTLIGTISYVFDAFTPPGILSALTTIACSRIFCAGIVPLFILDSIMNITGGWTFSIFGFIGVAFLPIPVVLYFFGDKLRRASRFSVEKAMADMPIDQGPARQMEVAGPLQNELMLCNEVLESARDAGYPVPEGVVCAPAERAPSPRN